MQVLRLRAGKVFETGFLRGATLRMTAFFIKVRCFRGGILSRRDVFELGSRVLLK